MQQLKSGFKRTIDWNKYLTKVTTQAPNPYLDFSTEPSFQGLFGLSFEDRTVSVKYCLLKVELKVITNGKEFLDQPVKSNLKTFDNIRKIAKGQGDDGTTVCLLDYNYSNSYYQMIAI